MVGCLTELGTGLSSADSDNFCHHLVHCQYRYTPKVRLSQVIILEMTVIVKVDALAKLSCSCSY